MDRLGSESRDAYSVIRAIGRGIEALRTYFQEIREEDGFERGEHEYEKLGCAFE
jgi:hypothetical protein